MIWTAVAFAAYAALVAVVYANAGDVLPRNPGFGLAHALVGAVMCGVTALLLVGHASSTKRRGYLSIAATFWYLSLLLLSFPIFFPQAIIPDSQLWGDAQSSADLYYAWHLVFPIGIGVSALLIHHDQRRSHRPDLSDRDIAGVLLATTAGALGTVLLVGFAGDLLPDVVTPGTLEKSPYATTLDYLILALCLICFGLSLYCARGGSLIGLWLAALSLLLVGEALVNERSPVRYSGGWYGGRALWLVCSTVLLVALIWNLSRVDRTNTELAAVDSVTGSMSRVKFLDALARETRWLEDHSDGDGRVALLWVDIDNFKGVNDQLGHPVGDDVLRQVNERIARHVSSEDHVGRLGGDEFGVLLRDSNGSQRAVEVASAILGAIREPIHSRGNVVHLTASVGCARAPDDAVSPDSLLLCADLAMYSAKDGVGDRFHWFNPDIGLQAMEKAKLRQALNAAIAERDFQLHYQPILETDGLQMVGAEALVRWDRNGQVVSAGQFIPGAEVSGQIVAIGHQVVDILLADLPRWLQDAPDDFFVSVNLSVKELADEALINRLLTGLGSEYAQSVVVEITESLELEGNAEAQGNLARLRLAGIRAAIDDFGTGFSNFTRLERLKPAILKVDRSLVRKAASQASEDRTFLAAATSVAASLHCEVVAEGVDDDATAAVIKQPGIRFVQGYWFGRPAPMETYLPLVGTY